MAFDFPGLVGSVRFNLQGACVRFNARFADSAFQIPVFRGHGTDVGSAQFTESLLQGTIRFLGDQILVFSAAKNHFHLNRSLKDKDSRFTSEILAYEIATPTPMFRNFPSRPMNCLGEEGFFRFLRERLVQFLS